MTILTSTEQKKMKDEIVKYRNELNSLNMKTWTAAEMNFFFAIIAKVKDHGTNTVTLDTYDLRELTEFANKNAKRWSSVVTSAADKCMRLIIHDNTNPKKLVIFSLFRRFEVDLNKHTVLVAIDEHNMGVLNAIDKQFTLFELSEFVKLKSAYSKQLYRLLKQWRTKGVFEISQNDFRELLSVPESYKQRNIDQKVLKICMSELTPIFKNLKLEKLHSKRRGNPVIGYRFEWTPEEPKPRRKALNGQYRRVEQGTDWAAKAQERDDSNLPPDDVIRQMFQPQDSDSADDDDNNAIDFFTTDYR